MPNDSRAVRVPSHRFRINDLTVDPPDTGPYHSFSVTKCFDGNDQQLQEKSTRQKIVLTKDGSVIEVLNVYGIQVPFLDIPAGRNEHGVLLRSLMSKPTNTFSTDGFFPPDEPQGRLVYFFEGLELEPHDADLPHLPPEEQQFGPSELEEKYCVVRFYRHPQPRSAKVYIKADQVAKDLQCIRDLSKPNKPTVWLMQLEEALDPRLVTKHKGRPSPEVAAMLEATKTRMEAADGVPPSARAAIAARRGGQHRGFGGR